MITLTRDQATRLNWQPYEAPPPIEDGLPRRDFSGPISALISNCYRWRGVNLADFEGVLQISVWTIEQLYDAGYVLHAPDDMPEVPRAQEGLDSPSLKPEKTAPAGEWSDPFVRRLADDAKGRAESRWVLLADDERFGLHAGDVLVCVPYWLDPGDKLTVLRRESDGFDPSCNVYRSEVRPFPGEHR